MNKISKLIGIGLILIILASISIFSVQATNKREQALKEDGDYLKYQRNKILAQNLENKSTPNTSWYYYPEPYSGYNKAMLIDVSACQTSINWTKVYNAGVKYAIIRVGGRGWETGEIYYDSRFYEYAKNAQKAGVKIGAYFFSAAINQAEAREEADWSINKIEAYGIKLDLPLFMDFEDTGTATYGRVKRNIKNTGEGAEIINAFCRQARSRGYMSGVYSGLNMLGNSSQGNGHWAEISWLDKENYIWFANWTNYGLSRANQYGLAVNVWQTGVGYVDGVSGQVDVDVIFTKKPNSVSNIKVSKDTNNNSTIKVEFSSNEKNVEYQIERYKDDKKLETKTVSSLSYQYKNCTPGTYYFKIRVKSKDLGINTYSDWNKSSKFKAEPTIGSKITFSSTPKSGSTTANSTATLKWNKVSNARGYYIYERKNDKWTLIDTKKVGSIGFSTYTYTVNLKYGVNKFLVKAYNDDFGKNNIVKSDGGKTTITRQKEYYTYTFKTEAAYKKMKKIFTDASTTDVTATDKTKTIKVWNEIVNEKIGAKLDLSNSNLTNTDLAEIFKYQYGKVANIDLSGNKLTSTANIKNCPNVTRLNLSNNSISDINDLYVVKDKLALLNLNNNKITNCGVLSQFSALKSLHLDNNYIENISSLNLSKIQTVSLENQTINKVVKEEYCNYPNIFAEAQKGTSRLYSKLYYCDCANDTAKNRIKITKANSSNIYVSIQSGVAKGTKLKITLGDKVLTGIEIGSKPTKVEYNLKEKLDLTGGTIRLKYVGGDDTISMTAKNVSVTGFDSNSVGKKTIKVTYSGKTTSFAITVSDNTLNSIEVDNNPNKTEYNVGDKLDLTGGKIKLKYNNGKESIVNMTSSEVSVTGFNSSRTGEQELTVTYKGKTTKFSIIVNETEKEEKEDINDDNERRLESISIQARPAKTIYIKDIDNLSLSGGSILAKYSDGSLEIINMAESEVKVSGFDNSKSGTNKLTVTYKGKTTTFNVLITEANLTSISIEKNPNKTTYTKDYDDLELDGGKIELKYSDNTREIIDMTAEGVEVEGFNNSELGTNTITVKYKEKEAKFTVQIVSKRLETMKILALPTKTTYIKDYDQLSLENGRIELVFSDKSQEIMDMESDELKVEGFDNSKVGKNTIKLTYDDKSVTFNITIVEKELEEISIDSYPRKREYIQMGEDLNLAGGKIKIVYSDGTEDRIDMTSDEVEIEGFDNSKVGTNTIIVKYADKSTNFDITIIADKNQPELEISGIPETTTIKNIVLEISVKDNESGLNTVTVNGKEIEIQDGKGTYEIKENGKYVFIAKDNVGNENMQEILIDKIGKLGDINQNGKIDANDLLKLVQHIAAQRTNKTESSWYLSEDKQKLADVNKDGKIDSRDVLKLKRYLAASRSENIKKKNPKWIDM